MNDNEAEATQESPNNNGDRFLSRTQVAKLLGVHPATVARIPTRSLPLFRFSRRLIRYRRRDVIRFIRAHASPKQVLMNFMT